MMKTFDQFNELIQIKLHKLLPEEYENATYTINYVDRLGGGYTGLTIRKVDEEEIVPTINMSLFYEYYREGKPIKDILNRMIYIICNERYHNHLEWINDYNIVKDKLFIRLSNGERNKEMLKNIPHLNIEDLVITYHIYIESNNHSVDSIMINNRLLNKYHLTTLKLHQDAIENSPKLFPIYINSLEKYLFNTQGDSSVIYLSNSVQVNGAATIIYPNTLKMIADKLNSGFYVVPSSIHEVLIVPPNIKSLYELEQLVHEVNEKRVSIDEQLSNHVYYYNNQTNTLKIAHAIN